MLLSKRGYYPFIGTQEELAPESEIYIDNNKFTQLYRDHGKLTNIRILDAHLTILETISNKAG